MMFVLHPIGIGWRLRRWPDVAGATTANPATHVTTDNLDCVVPTETPEPPPHLLRVQNTTVRARTTFDLHIRFVAGVVAECLETDIMPHGSQRKRKLVGMWLRRAVYPVKHCLCQFLRRALAQAGIGDGQPYLRPCRGGKKGCGDDLGVCDSMFHNDENRAGVK